MIFIYTRTHRYHYHYHHRTIIFPTRDDDSAVVRSRAQSRFLIYTSYIKYILFITIHVYTYIYAYGVRLCSTVSR